ALADVLAIGDAVQPRVAHRVDLRVARDEWRTGAAPTRRTPCADRSEVLSKSTCVRSGEADEAAVLLHDLAVGGHAAARAQAADEVPVQRAAVLATCLRVRAAEREVDGTADLLVEEDRAG